LPTAPMGCISRHGYCVEINVVAQYVARARWLPKRDDGHGQADATPSRRHRAGMENPNRVDQAGHAVSVGSTMAGQGRRREKLQADA
jgi:hypothetical protein